MIRDPSDGSVKPPTKSAPGFGTSQKIAERGPSEMPGSLGADTRSKYGPNYGLKSLDREARKPKPAPTAEELRQHYAKHKLGFEPKEEAE